MQSFTLALAFAALVSAAPGSYSTPKSYSPSSYGSSKSSNKSPPKYPSKTPSKTSSSKPSVHSQYVVANYDNITVVPALPLANTLGTYEGLTYTAWAVNEAGVDGAAQLAGVAPESSPNNIVSGIEQTGSTGTNAEFSTTNTTTKYFDLLSFYYGCSVNTAEGAESVAQDCTFDVRGYREVSDANPVASSQFSFTPKATELLAEPMKATFGKSFEKIQRVELVQLESTSGEATNVLVLDNVAYNLYT